MPRRNRRSGAKASDTLNDVAKAAREERTEVFQRTKMCKFHILGICAKGDACHFAHERLELNSLPDLYRTKLCKTLINTGRCEDRACRYAHNKDELRTSTGAKKTRVCRHWLQGTCELGERCSYSHAEAEEQEDVESKLTLPQAVHDSQPPSQMQAMHIAAAAAAAAAQGTQSSNQMQAMQAAAAIHLASSAMMQAAVMQMVQAQSTQPGVVGPGASYNYSANMAAQMAAAGIVPSPSGISVPGFSQQVSAENRAGTQTGGGKSGVHSNGKGVHGQGGKGGTKTNRRQQGNRQQLQPDNPRGFLGHCPGTSFAFDGPRRPDSTIAGGEQFSLPRTDSSSAASVGVKNTFIDIPAHGSPFPLRAIHSAAGRLDALAAEESPMKGSAKHMVFLEQSLPTPHAYQLAPSHQDSESLTTRPLKGQFLQTPAHIQTETLRSIGSSGSLTALADESLHTPPRSPNVPVVLPIGPASVSCLSTGARDTADDNVRSDSATRGGYVVKNTFLEDASAPPACSLRTVRTAGGRLDALDEEGDEDTLPSNVTGCVGLNSSLEPVSVSIPNETKLVGRSHPRLVNPGRLLTSAGNTFGLGDSRVDPSMEYYSQQEIVQEAEAAAGPSPNRLLVASRHVPFDIPGTGQEAREADGDGGGGPLSLGNERVALGELGSTSGMHVKNTFLDFGPAPAQGGLRAVQTFAGRLDLLDPDD